MVQAKEKDEKPIVSAPAVTVRGPFEVGYEDIPIAAAPAFLATTHHHFRHGASVVATAAAPDFEKFLRRPAYRRVVTPANGREGAQP